MNSPRDHSHRVLGRKETCKFTSRDNFGLCYLTARLHIIYSFPLHTCFFVFFFDFLWYAADGFLLSLSFIIVICTCMVNSLSIFQHSINSGVFVHEQTRCIGPRNIKQPCVKLHLSPIWAKCVIWTMSPSQFFLCWCKPGQIEAEAWHFNVVPIIFFQTEFAEAKKNNSNCPSTYSLNCTSLWQSPTDSKGWHTGHS